MRKLAEDVAKDQNINLQIAITGGSTDGAAIQDCGAAMIPIGVPVRYTHSKVECSSLQDMKDSVNIILGIVEKLLH